MPRSSARARWTRSSPRTSTGCTNPNGAAELDDAHIAEFRLVGCPGCGSDLLKPDVVFFGENVPRPRVARCHGAVDASSALLVLGSSLTVMSGLRFVHRAHERSIPVASVTQGVTRGDPLADLKLHAPLGPTLTALSEQIAVSPAARG